MLFDDGCGIPERTLVTIGDYCTLNVGTAIQGHSQEDGAFKSERITIGSGCTIGIDALVHYGVTIGDDVVLGPSSFLMKGSEVPPGTHWAGNPADEVPQAPATPQAGVREPSTPAALPAPRPGDGPDPLEEFVTAIPADADPPADIPVPRRSGRHRARGRHEAGTR